MKWYKSFSLHKKFVSMPRNLHLADKHALCSGFDINNDNVNRSSDDSYVSSDTADVCVD